MCLRRVSEAEKIRILYSEAGDSRERGGGKVKIMYGTGRGEGNRANVSTPPEGNAGEGEEIRALLFKSVPVAIFFFLTNKLVYRDIRSGSCLCSFFVVPRDVIPATIPLLILNKRRGDKTEYFSMERKSCVVKVIIIILSERKRATQNSLCLGMKVCLSAPPAPRSGFISSNL